MTTSAIDSCIHQEVDLNASPARVFEILLDQDRLSECTGAAAQIQREAGEPFALFGGRVTGRTIELLPDQRIVQAWRVESWPSGIYSIVRLELTATGSGSRLVLDHTGFPPEDRETLTGNWSRMYWNPLRAYLDS